MQNATTPAGFGVQRGHPLGFGGKGDFVDARKPRVQIRFAQSGFGRSHDQGPFGRIALKVPPALALDVYDLGVRSQRGGLQQPPQWRRRFLRLSLPGELTVRLVADAGDLHQLAGHQDAADGHFVLGQRARLVRTDDGGAAQRFHHGQAADQGMPAHHPLDAHRQRDGDDGGQRFGNHGHRQGDAKDQHLQQWLAAPQAQEHDHPHDGKRRVRQLAADAVQVLLQRRPAGLDRLQQLGDLAELGLHARGHDHGAAAAVSHRRPGKSHVSAVAHGGLTDRQRSGLLLDRQRLARQHGFVDLEIDRFDQPHVRGHSVSGTQQNHIAGHQVTGRDFGFSAVPKHGRQRRCHAAERLDGTLGTKLLGEPQNDGKHHDHGDRDGFHGMAQERRQHRRHKQDDDQDVLELLQQQPPGGDSLRFPQFVLAVGRQPLRGFAAAQARGRRLELGENLFDG